MTHNWGVSSLLSTCSQFLYISILRAQNSNDPIDCSPKTDAQCRHKHKCNDVIAHICPFEIGSDVSYSMSTQKSMFGSYPATLRSLTKHTSFN